MPRYRVVFLDMGDTLVRLTASLNAAYHQAAVASGKALDEDHLARTLGELTREADERNRHEGYAPDEETDRQYWRDFNSRLLQRLDIAEHLWAGTHDEIERAFVDPANFVLFPDVHETLGKLGALGYRLAILSNWSWHLDQLCAALDLERYFERLIISARVGHSKPHPAIFRHALDAMQVRPEEAIHVGDNPIADVGGALGVGITPILLDRVGRDAAVEVPHRVAGLLDLLPLLRALERGEAGGDGTPPGA